MLNNIYELNIVKDVKKLRQEKGIFQDRFFKLTDIFYNTVIKLESGAIINPSIYSFQKLAKAFDVSIDDLLK